MQSQNILPDSPQEIALPPAPVDRDCQKRISHITPFPSFPGYQACVGLFMHPEDYVQATSLHLFPQLKWSPCVLHVVIAGH